KNIIFLNFPDALSQLLPGHHYGTATEILYGKFSCVFIVKFKIRIIFLSLLNRNLIYRIGEFLGRNNFPDMENLYLSTIGIQNYFESIITFVLFPDHSTKHVLKNR